MNVDLTVVEISTHFRVDDATHSKLLHRVVLDRKTVAIPTWHIAEVLLSDDVCCKTEQDSLHFAAHENIITVDDILDNLI